MGAEDVRRQALNVFRIKLLGATVVAVEAGAQTLRDAVNEALRAWVRNKLILWSSLQGARHNLANLVMTLGGRSRHNTLYYWKCNWSSPLSHDCPNFPKYHRPRDKSPNAATAPVSI